MISKGILKVVLLSMLFCLMFSMTAFAGTKEANIVPFLKADHGTLSVNTKEMYYIDKDTVNDRKMIGIDVILGLHLNETGVKFFKEECKLEKDPFVVAYAVKFRQDPESKKIYKKVVKERVYRSNDINDYLEIDGDTAYVEVSDNKFWLTSLDKLYSIAVDLQKQGKWIND